MTLKLLRLFACFITGPLAFCPLHALQISGSDLLGEPVRLALDSGLKAAEVPAELTFDGSLLGLRDLESGRVDASLLAIPDNRSLDSGLRRFPIGFQIVAVAVHQTNPVVDVSYSNLVNLFRDNGTIEDWSDLTSDPVWSDRKVTLLASRREDAITLELFNALVLQGDRLKPSVRYTTDLGNDLVAAIVEDTTTLALVPAMEASGPVKFLAVRESADYQSYTPSQDNVFFGDYPLRLPFYLIVSEDLEESVLHDLLKVLYSDEVSDALTEANCLPVPEQERQAILGQF